jgi:hypothetical protein
MKGSPAVRTVVAAVVMLIAMCLVAGYAYRGDSASSDDLVRCAVCGSVLPRGQMQVYPAESNGATPDQLPVYVCSDACTATVRIDPEKYRQKTVW